MKYIYTASKLATSTCERKLTCITPANFWANPFTIWTHDHTFPMDPAICLPSVTEYKTVYRSPNNRASRKAAHRAKADIICLCPLVSFN